MKMLHVKTLDKTRKAKECDSWNIFIFAVFTYGFKFLVSVKCPILIHGYIGKKYFRILQTKNQYDLFEECQTW